MKKYKKLFLRLLLILIILFTLTSCSGIIPEPPPPPPSEHVEIADSHKEKINGLILESGFAWAGPLLNILGIDPDAIGFKEETGFRNVDKIKAFDKPALIIHAEQDHIIPFSDGQALYNACSASDKTFLEIPGANHNDIFMRGLSEYMAAVKALSDRVN